MNADDSRDYMLAFLFLRYLSDNYQQAAADALFMEGPVHPDHQLLDLCAEALHYRRLYDEIQAVRVENNKRREADLQTAWGTLDRRRSRRPPG